MKSAEDVALRLAKKWGHGAPGSAEYVEVVQALTAFADERVKEVVGLGALDTIHQARAEALEEAAKLVDEKWLCGSLAAEHIRALKDKP